MKSKAIAFLSLAALGGVAAALSAGLKKKPAPNGTGFTRWPLASAYDPEAEGPASSPYTVQVQKTTDARTVRELPLRLSSQANAIEVMNSAFDGAEQPYRVQVLHNGQIVEAVTRN